MEALDLTKVSPTELVGLCALDSGLYGRTFFPKAFRQASPAMHQEIWQGLENPANRFVAIEVFRGGAKTTLLRAFTSKRIAYGISHTILFVSASLSHSVKTIAWLKRAVEYNEPWARTYGLRKGEKWTEDEIEILHGVEGFPIRVIAVGITGQTRGLNIDDYRPDLIVVDDPCDEENTRTHEGREKISNLFFGALAKSLAPASENPHAKMVLLQTPLDADDLIEKCLVDPQWHGMRFSCFDDAGESRWPARWTTQELLEDKAAHIKRRQLALWLREMECAIVSDETAYFAVTWLNYYTVLPDGARYYIVIDPAPVKSEAARRKATDTDWQVIVVVAFHKGNMYLVDYAMEKDEDPEALAVKLFQFLRQYRISRVGVETFAYQRTLKWYIEKRMRETGIHAIVEELQDKRGKREKIRQGLAPRASTGCLYVRDTHVEFISAFGSYPNVKHDDLLEAAALAPLLINGSADSILEGDYDVIENDIPELGDDWRLL